MLYYNCRFKRSVTPISYEIVDGSHHVIERKRWDAMTRESGGSILSKMIRKGINNPEGISDILGAMFIVNDADAMDDLLMLLDEVVANPIGWRNVTDTLSGGDHGNELNPYSGQGFKVFKGDLDILYPRPGPRAPRLPLHRGSADLHARELPAHRPRRPRRQPPGPQVASVPARHRAGDLPAGHLRGRLAASGGHGGQREIGWGLRLNVPICLFKKISRLLVPLC